MFRFIEGENKNLKSAHKLVKSTANVAIFKHPELWKKNNWG